MSVLFQFLLILAALGLGFFGFISLSEATFGVGLIALGALCGILARISQAAAHQRNIETRLSEMASDAARDRYDRRVANGAGAETRQG